MNVGELIQRLEGYPEDWLVLYSVGLGYDDVVWVDMETALTTRATDLPTGPSVVLGS